MTHKSANNSGPRRNEERGILCPRNAQKPTTLPVCLIDLCKYPRLGLIPSFTLPGNESFDRVEMSPADARIAMQLGLLKRTEGGVARSLFTAMCNAAILDVEHGNVSMFVLLLPRGGMAFSRIGHGPNLAGDLWPARPDGGSQR